MAHFKHVALCSVVALQGIRSVGAQDLPTLRGYQLGTPRKDARASTLPCGHEPITKRLRCDAPGNVQLYFDHDTLTGVTVNFERLATGARERWFAISDSLVALYGDPDSVRVKDEQMGTTLGAYWGPFTRLKPWGRSYHAVEMRLGGEILSQSWFGVYACFWEDQDPACKQVLQQPPRGKGP